MDTLPLAAKCYRTVLQKSLFSPGLLFTQSSGGGRLSLSIPSCAFPCLDASRMAFPSLCWIADLLQNVPTSPFCAFFLCWLSVLPKQCSAAGLLFHLGNNFICRMTFLYISFLVSKKLLQAVYLSPGLLAHRWHCFFRTAELSLSSHETIETAFAFHGSSLQVLAFPTWGSL